MQGNNRWIEITYLLMVILSAALLGLGQGNLALSVTAIGLAILAWILVDLLKLFSLPRWVANVLSIAVLLYSMRRFFGTEAGSQLIAVANLLIYLQSLLLLQSKTPRQYWQLIILNLLQLVVASVFSIQLEGGVLFMLYMVVAAFFLFLLTNYDELFRTQSINFAGTERTQSVEVFFGKKETRPSGVNFNYRPLPLSRAFFRASIGHLVPAISASLAFALILFVLIPRTQDAWLAARVAPVATTGISKSVRLNERGEIKLTSTAVMRVKFTNMVSGEPIQISGNPYFRGMALSRLVIRNNVTHFEAPYDRVFFDDFELIPQISYRNSRLPAPYINADYTLESTTDPLLFATIPVLAPAETSTPAEVCRPLSALTRARMAEFIELAPFQYRLVTRINAQFELPRAFPYVSPSRIRSTMTLNSELGEFQSLTDIPKERYPVLVQTASRLASQVPSKNTLEICNRIESHFLNSAVYKYTLDYTNVPRNNQLDAVEDFVANHHTGHCEVYAAAMVLMLRSQGIPARLVVGYCGGDWMNEFYCVNNTFAHAWVEAYIPPEHCTQQMIDNKEAGQGGAWMRFEPTPATGIFANNASGGSSFQLARSLWQDYVLGLDDAQSLDLLDVPSSRLAGFLDISQWSTSLQNSVANFQTNPFLQTVVILISIALLVWLSIISLRSTKRKSVIIRNPKAGLIRRLAAKALSLISPDLGRWLLTERKSVIIVPFYERFVALMRKWNLERQPTMSHRDFGQTIIAEFAKRGIESRSHSIVAEVTDRYHEVRFGGKPLDDQILRELERNLKQLEKLLAQQAAKV
ncbi:MAG: transglutaminaseTgpA domain-containing protein [Pirellulaceae bacterium]